MKTFEIEEIVHRTIILSDAEYDLILTQAVRTQENWLYSQKQFFPTLVYIKFLRVQHNIGLKHAKDIVDSIVTDAMRKARKEVIKYD